MAELNKPDTELEQIQQLLARFWNTCELKWETEPNAPKKVIEDFAGQFSALIHAHTAAVLRELQTKRVELDHRDAVYWHEVKRLIAREEQRAAEGGE